MKNIITALLALALSACGYSEPIISKVFILKTGSVVIQIEGIGDTPEYDAIAYYIANLKPNSIDYKMMHSTGLYIALHCDGITTEAKVTILADGMPFIDIIPHYGP
jgi:hypothetical protein